jgi:long-subunit acyl-CoA synthetase (AMP-forming)
VPHGKLLRSLGVSAGDRVMLLAKDGPAFFIGDHAATSASFRIRADASASVVG